MAGIAVNLQCGHLVPARYSTGWRSQAWAEEALEEDVQATGEGTGWTPGEQGSISDFAADS